jgi:polyisoprenoid-binding protein YceI
MFLNEALCPRAIRVLLLSAVVPALLHAAPRPIDTAQSAITIHVGKSGFFSAFGHEHVVRAPIAEGTIEESGPKPHVEFRVDARQLKVVDPDTKPEERAQIQSDMQGPKVLESEKYPEIRFRSTAIERVAEGKWKVSGELTLHSQTQPVEATVSGGKGRYRGTANFKQTQFGIRPVAVAGGSVKVKDDLRIEFEIAAQ